MTCSMALSGHEFHILPRNMNLLTTLVNFEQSTLLSVLDLEGGYFLGGGGGGGGSLDSSFVVLC